MPLSVFAALELRPGPDSSGVWLNGSTAVPQVERGAAARPERQRREARLGALAQRMLKEPRRRGCCAAGGLGGASAGGRWR